MRWLRHLLGRRCPASWQDTRCDLTLGHEGKCFATRGRDQRTWPTDYREEWKP